MVYMVRTYLREVQQVDPVASRVQNPHHHLTKFLKQIDAAFCGIVGYWTGLQDRRKYIGCSMK